MSAKGGGADGRSDATMTASFFLFWGAVLGVNLAWLFVLPGRSGRLVALTGTIVALVVVAAAVGPSSGRDYVRRGWPPALDRPQHATVSLVPFLLPAWSLWFSPTIAFWRLDGRGWLLLAWLAVTGILVGLQRWQPDGASRSRASASLPFAVSLLLLWTSAFWLTVVSDLGVGRFVIEVNRIGRTGCQYDPLATTFATWETIPASRHLFLAWRTPRSFGLGQPYAHHSHPYLVAMYGWTAAVRLAGRVPLYVATNTTPLLSILILLAAGTTLLARAGLLKERPGPVVLATLFLGYGFLITTWRLWDDFYRYTSDNPYSLLAAVFVFVFAYLLAPMRPALATLSAMVFVAISPIYTPMLVVTVLCAFGERGATLDDVLTRNRTLIRLVGVALIVGVVIYATPWLLIGWKGYSPQSSSFVFRSGLDGDTRYFTGLLQAIVAPCAARCCGGRTISELMLPAFLPLGVFGLWATLGRRELGLSFGRQLMFLCAPYLISVVLFPQSVSIHPYLYDHFLLIPIVLTGLMAALTAPVQNGLRGVGLLACLLFAAALIMSNLISIAQGLARMPPG